MESSPVEIDRAIADLSENARAFARTPPSDKEAILREILPLVLGTAREQVELACRAKGLDPDAPLAGEEWLAGPFVTVANVRLLAESLAEIATRGRPSLGPVRQRADGRVTVHAYPVRATDRMLFAGSTADVLLTEGSTVADAAASQAAFYQDLAPEGGVSLVLGAGNVASIPPTDTLHKLFVDGKVVLLKMNPVNAYLGPLLERALAPLTQRGLLRIVYGGAEVGAYVVGHPAIADVHITGSDKTHDAIVWGPPGPERDRRKADGDPVLKKPITSELGNISPVMVAPHLYDKDELWFLARNVATQVVNNASFNCNAGKLLVLPKGWGQRDVFLGLVEKALTAAAPRKAYYPGAFDRYAALTGGRDDVFRVELPGELRGECLPWTILRGVDAGRADEPLFSTEPFCGMISETQVGSTDPVEFFAAATRFCNERVWGTLNCSIAVHPLLEDDPAIAAALDRAVLELRYGAVAINHWPAVVYGLVVPPWGGHPSATLADVQSGIGFVHNTPMLGRVEKTVIRGPLRQFPKPPVFYDNKKMNILGERLTAYVAAPSLAKVLGIAAVALRG